MCFVAVLDRHGPDKSVICCFISGIYDLNTIILNIPFFLVPTYS